MQLDPRNNSRFTPKSRGRGNDVGLNSEILVDKFCGPSVVGQDATHLRRGQKNVFRALLGKETNHCSLVGQIQLRMRPGDNLGAALARQASHDGRSRQPPVARNINSGASQTGLTRDTHRRYIRAS